MTKSIGFRPKILRAKVSYKIKNGNRDCRFLFLIPCFLLTYQNFHQGLVLVVLLAVLLVVLLGVEFVPVAWLITLTLRPLSASLLSLNQKCLQLLLLQ